MSAVSSPELLRQLLTLLETVDVSFLCASSRIQRDQLKFLDAFAVRFRRDVLVEEDSVDSIQKALASFQNVQIFSLGLAYQTDLSRSICQLVNSLYTHRLTSLTLDLRHCGLGDAGVQALARSLAVLRLQHLALRLSFNKISNRGADDLSQALGSSLVDVALHMDINLIGESAPKLLGAVLAAQQVQQAHIDLAHCRLGDAVALRLADMLESHASRCLTSQRLHVDLRGNNLSETKERIIKALACLNATKCKCLIELD